MKTRLIFVLCFVLGFCDSEPRLIAFSDFVSRNQAYEEAVSGLEARARPGYVTLLGDWFTPRVLNVYEPLSLVSVNRLAIVGKGFRASQSSGVIMGTI